MTDILREPDELDGPFYVVSGLSHLICHRGDFVSRDGGQTWRRLYRNKRGVIAKSRAFHGDPMALMRGAA